MTKIKKLSIKNFLGIKEKEFKPGKVNIIKGKNEEGKTSILEALEKGLYNDDRRVKFINEDGDKTEIIIELDNGMEVSRRITEKGNYLDVMKDGFKQKAPQTTLKELVGPFAFNPVDFIDKKPDKQAEILLNCMDISVSEEDIRNWLSEINAGEINLPMVDFEQHGLKVVEQIKEAFYEKRRVKNKEQENLSNKYANEMEKIPGDFEPEKHRGIKLRDKYNKLQEKQEKNKKIDKTKQLIKDFNNEIEKKDMKIEELKNKIAELEEQKSELKESKKKAQNFLNNNEKVDTSQLEKEIEEFEENKELLNTYDRAKEIKEEKEEVYKEWEQLDEVVKLLQNKPSELVKQANLPIEGLEVKEDQVLINDRPIKNLSTEEKIKVGLEIARETASDVKLICIDRFESLDPDNQEKMLEEMKKDEFQYFVTEVTGDDGVNIEAINGERKVNPETGEVI